MFDLCLESVKLSSLQSFKRAGVIFARAILEVPGRRGDQNFDVELGQGGTIKNQTMHVGKLEDF